MSVADDHLAMGDKLYHQLSQTAKKANVSPGELTAFQELAVMEYAAATAHFAQEMRNTQWEIRSQLRSSAT